MVLANFRLGPAPAERNDWPSSWSYGSFAWKIRGGMIIVWVFQLWCSQRERWDNEQNCWSSALHSHEKLEMVWKALRNQWRENTPAMHTSCIIHNVFWYRNKVFSEIRQLEKFSSWRGAASGELHRTSSEDQSLKHQTSLYHKSNSSSWKGISYRSWHWTRSLEEESIFSLETRWWEGWGSPSCFWSLDPRQNF